MLKAITQKYRLLIVDNQVFMREGLKSVLDAERDMEVVGLSSSGNDVFDHIYSVKPDLVLIDTGLPVLEGIEYIEALIAAHPDTKFSILANRTEAEFIVKGLSCGISGYLLKSMNTECLVLAIRDIARGQFVLPDTAAAELAKYMKQLQKYALAATSSWGYRAELTNRENLVAELMLSGMNNDQIARKMLLTGGTVRNYISSIYSKLQAKNRTEALAMLSATKKRRNA